MDLKSARSFDRRQRRIARHALIQARKARYGPLEALVSIVVAAQDEAATDAVGAVPLMLAEQGIGDEPVADVVPLALAGSASDGRSLPGLLDYMRLPIVSPEQFDKAVLTQVADAGRGATSVATAVRPGIGGYVRMLVPPSCGRCAILAGRTYRWSTGFQRHPRCDCRMIPSVESAARDLTVNPRQYFESLPTANELRERHPDLTVRQRREAGLVSQEDVFTVSGARAIRDGADPSQVVNARAGMSTAQIQLRGPGGRFTAQGRLETRRVYGRDIYTTTEGTTRRGLAYRAMRDSIRGRAPRLMPESIYAIAEDREDAIRLLRINGYIQ